MSFPMPSATSFALSLVSLSSEHQAVFLSPIFGSASLLPSYGVSCHQTAYLDPAVSSPAIEQYHLLYHQTGLFCHQASVLSPAVGQCPFIYRRTVFFHSPWAVFFHLPSSSALS